MNNMRRRNPKKRVVRPIMMLYKFMNRARVEVWIVDDNNVRFQGKIVGLDEFMNITMKDTVELNMSRGTERKIGTIILKGENICTVHTLDELTV